LLSKLGIMQRFEASKGIPPQAEEAK